MDDLNAPNDDEAQYDESNPATWDAATMPWSITDDSLASWALAKMQRARFEQERIRLAAQDEHRRIDQWVERTSRGPLRDEEFFEGHLRRYYEKVAAEGGLYGKSKSYPLVNGTLKARAGSERVEVVDEAACLDFAEGHARVELLNVKISPNKPAIKKALQAGEQIPGVELVVGEPTFQVEVSVGEAPAFLPMPESEVA